ncbi:hypothetical protein BGZ80_010207 [Entomortierella chlamydospora]|uniref:Uncharacterized protein n=1 Tax=Entomortierella chlamydospora TaxID=101097 RepID=A0A9P6MVP3_9FUNG|nr:hypothetical protein BGZ79_010065 [Entomortierella chlamydospora]KAG0014826.1 hypothetical protein BGZ80_010207 [Entomortierella chlamydospora]
MPPSIAKVLSMPELLDLIIQAVIRIQWSPILVQGEIRRLRLVSHAFHVAANPYFAVHMIDSPFGGDKFDDFRRKYEEKIRTCGFYIRELDLTSGPNNNMELMGLIGDCCPNVEEVVFSFFSFKENTVDPLGYCTLLKKWSSTYTDDDDNNSNNNDGNYNGCGRYKNNLKKVTIRRNLDWEGGTTDNSYEGFERIREYLRGIETLIIKGLYIHDTPEIVPHRPCWETFMDFFRSLPNLVSFDTNEIYIPWSQLPPTVIMPSEEMSFPNLTSLSFHFGALDLSTIIWLNRMFPKLEKLDFNRLDQESPRDEPNGQGKRDGASVLLSPMAVITNSVKLTIKRIRIKLTQVENVHELLGIAPALKTFICGCLQTQRDLNEHREDLFAVIKPFGGRDWDELRLYTPGGSYLPLDWKKILNSSSKSNDQ